MTVTNPLTLVHPQASEPRQQLNLQSALRTLAVLSHCSNNLKELSESISQAVSRTISPNSSNAAALG
jgi:hypothetical protein